MFGERDNWTLDGICEDELGEQKLENPFSTFKEFYSGEGVIKSEKESKFNKATELSYKRFLIEQEILRRGLSIN
jgi:hypothetical protein